MNDTESALYGWRCKLGEIRDIRMRLKAREEEAESMVNFWKNKIEEEKNAKGEKDE